MSKYTEATELLRGTIFKCYICNDGFAENCKKCDFLFETCFEALRIADRLEHAHWTRSDGISDILYDLDCTAGVSQSDIFVQGYEKALADIRGDTE